MSVAFFPDFGEAALLPALMAIFPFGASTGLCVAVVLVAAWVGREFGVGLTFTAGRGAAAGLCAAVVLVTALLGREIGAGLAFTAGRGAAAGLRAAVALVAALVGRDALAGGFAFPVERGATADLCAAEALLAALAGRDAGVGFLLTSCSPRIGGYTCSVGRLPHSLPLREPRIVATL